MDGKRWDGGQSSTMESAIAKCFGGHDAHVDRRVRLLSHYLARDV